MTNDFPITPENAEPVTDPTTPHLTPLTPLPPSQPSQDSQPNPDTIHDGAPESSVKEEPATTGTDSIAEGAPTAFAQLPTLSSTPENVSDATGADSASEDLTHQPPASTPPVQPLSPGYPPPSTHIAAVPPVYPPASVEQPTKSHFWLILTLAIVLTALLTGIVTGTVTSLMTKSSSPATVTNSTLVYDPELHNATTAAVKIRPSVVTIAVQGYSTSTGSGVVYQADGYIITNNHVVDSASEGGTIKVTLADDTTHSAKIIGTDPSSDLAVIKIDKTGLTPATFTDSNTLKVGQPVVAVGAPLGLSNTVTEGIISTLNRPVTTGDQSQTSFMDAIQTDASINPGNSGGPLVDLAGQVVGINSAIATVSSSSSGNIGVGFAIPSNDVIKVTKQLIATGKAVHPKIGVTVDTSSSDTATLKTVSPDSPAAKAGLKPGDVIIKVNDRKVNTPESLIVALRSVNQDGEVSLTYLQNGQEKTVKVQPTI